MKFLPENGVKALMKMSPDDVCGTAVCDFCQKIQTGEIYEVDLSPQPPGTG
jgi:hypothetical protein